MGEKSTKDNKFKKQLLIYEKNHPRKNKKNTNFILFVKTNIFFCNSFSLNIQMETYQVKKRDFTKFRLRSN